jgi:hypothetical protein
MTLSIDSRPPDVSRRATQDSSSAKPETRASKARRLDDPCACQMEGQLADLKRRIPTLKRLIEDCDRLIAELDQEIQNEENRVKIHDPKAVTYSAYARATAARRDNLRRSADELRAHLAKAENTLLYLGEGALEI